MEDIKYNCDDGKKRTGNEILKTLGDIEILIKESEIEYSYEAHCLENGPESITDLNYWLETVTENRRLDYLIKVN